MGTDGGMGGNARAGDGPAIDARRPESRWCCGFFDQIDADHNQH